MNFIKNLSKPIFILSAILFGQNAIAQLTPNGAYLMGNIAEIGINNKGHEGTYDIGGSNARSDQWDPAVYFGFVANPQNDGWVNYDGDFFTPGSPENGFGMEINGTNFCNNSTWENEIPGALSNYTVDGNCLSVQWDGSVNNVAIKIVYKFNTTELYYTTEVTITNNTGSALTDLYYYRNFDPDNNVSISFDYTTQNTIVAQPSLTCPKALVSATSSTPWLSYVGIAAIGPDFRVSHGGFSNRDASDIWNGTWPLTGTAGASVFMDEAISMAYKIANLPAGASETFEFVIILDDTQVDEAFAQLYEFSFPGYVGAGSVCNPVTDSAYVPCPGAIVTLSVGGPSVADYNWVWSPAGGLSSTTGATVDASPGSTTTYTVTGTPVNPCLSMVITKDIVVSVGIGPFVVITDPGPLCGTFDLTTLIVTDGNGIAGTTTTFHSVIPSSATDMTNLWPGTTMAAGDIVYVMIGDPIGGCYDVEQVIIDFSGGANAGPNNVAAICNAPGSTLDMNTLLGVGVDPGVWSETTSSGQFNTVTGLFDASGLTNGAYTFQYSVPAVVPCLGDVADFTVNVSNLPNAGADNSLPACNGFGTINLNTLLIGADAGGIWTETTLVPSGQLTALTGIFNSGAVPMGVYTFAYTIPSAGTCIGDQAIMTITVQQYVTAGIDNNGSVCNAPGSTFNLNSLLLGNNTVGFWTETSGSGQFNAGTGVLTSAGLPAGSYNFTYTVNGVAPCFSDIAQFTVIVADLPTAGADNSSTVCNTPGSIINLNTLLSGANVICTWSETTFSGQFNPFTGILTSAGLPNGVYTFNYTYAGSGVCPGDQATFTITVNVEPSVADLADQTHCNSYILPTIVGSNMTGGQAYFTGAGGTGTQYNAGDIITSSVLLHIYDETGSTPNCYDEQTVMININPTPMVSFVADTLSGCAPFVVNFTNTTPGTTQNCVWNFGGSGYGQLCGNITHTFLNPGTYTVSLSLQGGGACPSSSTITNYITVVAPPVADFSFLPQLPNIDDSEVEFTNTSDFASNYLWDFGDNTSSTDTSPVHIFPIDPNVDYLVTLYAYNSVGCMDSMIQMITVEDVLTFFIPNTFTPDGDALNQMFSPVFTSGVDPYDFHMIIFDRWGQILFESYNPQVGWTGTYSNQGVVPDGTYIWQIEFKETMSDKRHTHNGHVTILK